MLIEFSVANFRSIKERQSLSMVAAKGKELEDTHTFEAPFNAGKGGMRLLRSAVVVGANAAGKTNLLTAMQRLCVMVVESALDRHRGSLLPVMPFMLEAGTRSEPSEFEVHFVVDGVRYQYGVSATRERVMEEWLIAFPHNRGQRWFDRAWLADKGEYGWRFGASLAGEKGLRELWRGATRENALFLSTAVQLNSEQLRPIYDWFPGKFPSITMPWNMSASASLCDQGRKNEVMNFIKAADLGIDDVHVEKKSITHAEVLKDMPESMKQAFIKEMKDAIIYEVSALHLDADNNIVPFKLNDESGGTVRMFVLAGYWLDALKNGGVIFIDELNNHLHIEIVEFLLTLFHNNETNPNNAQLVFTTHVTATLNQSIVRRDQVWFCEKDRTGVTTVYPLSDFRLRKGRGNVELGYRSGAYGALPFVNETLMIHEE